MADYPIFDEAEFALYTGQSSDSFTEYAETAFGQSVLLFKLATGLIDSVPDSPSYVAELVSNALMSMTEYLYYRQKHAEVISSPYRSESLGSYSYTLMLAAIRAGEDTGVSWFDIAVVQLGVNEESGNYFTGGGIEVFEGDGEFTTGYGADRNIRLLGPTDFGTRRHGLG